MTQIPGALLAGPRRLAAAPWLLRLPLLAALGALAGLGQAPASLPVATLAALVVLMLLQRGGGLGFGAGWAFGLGHFALSLRWMVEPFLVEPERTGWMAPFALLLAAAGFALFWGLPFALARRLRLGPWGLAALWTAAEMARAFLLTGFPWALLGHVWLGTPLEQLAALVGAHGLTLMTLMAAAAMASPVPLALRAVAPALLLVGALLLDPGQAPAPDPAAPVIRVVQPNVPQSEKWDPARMPAHVRRLVALSGPPPGGGAAPADLVVWPETALTDLLDWSGPVLAAGTAAAGGAPLATGGFDQDAEGRFFNTLAVTDGQGRVLSTYDKVHLVPFGEYMPFRGLLEGWGLDLLANFQGPGFTAAEGAELLDLPGIGPARALICYEGIFPEEIDAGWRRGLAWLTRGALFPEALAAPRPRLLLLVTNDAWFGERAGPVQHFELGRLRAIEFGLPLVRSANTGISAMVDARGRTLADLPLHEAGAFDAALPPALPPTLYARAGDWPVVLALLLLGLGALGARRRRAQGIDRGAPRP